MPTFVVRAPDGRELEVNGPEGATQEQALAYAQQHLASLDEGQSAAHQQNIENAKMRPDPTGDGLENFLAGAGKSVVDTGRGIKQIGAQLGNKLGIVSDEALHDVNSDIERARTLDKPLDSTVGGTLGEGAGMLGQAMVGGAGLKVLGEAAQIPQLLRAGAGLALPKTVAGSAAQGAAYGALQPTVEDETRLGGAVAGGAGGAAGGVVGKLVGRLLRPVRSSLSPELAGLAQDAERLGVPLRPAQQTGSKPLKILDSVFDNLPLTSSANLAEKEAQQLAFNRASLKTIGENADVASPDVLSAARSRIGGQFKALTSGTDVKLDNQFLNQLAKVDGQNSQLWQSLRSDKVSGVIDDALDALSRGKMSGEEYQQVRSAISKRAQDAFGSQNSALGQALKGLQSALDEAAERSLPADKQAAWNLAREQWGNLKVLEKAAAPNSAGGVQGHVSGAKLAQALMSAGNKQGFIYGTKGGDLPSLARIGQAFLKDQIPDSGSAQRLMYQQMLTNPLGALGLGAGGAAYGHYTGEDPWLSAGVAVGAPLALRSALASKLGKYYLTRAPSQNSTIQALTSALRGASASGGAEAGLARRP